MTGRVPPESAHFFLVDDFPLPAGARSFSGARFPAPFRSAAAADFPLLIFRRPMRDG